MAEVKQVQQNVRMVKLLIDDDSKRRTATLGASQHFDFPAADAADGPAGLFSPLSAPSLTPLHVGAPVRAGGHAPPSAFNFSQELMTPASALTAHSFPSESLPPVPERLVAFYGTTAAPATAGLERQLQGVQTEYEALQAHYACGDAPWEAFYALWSGFVDEWLAVEEEMEVEREREARRRRQAETQEAMAKKKRDKAAAEAASKAEREEKARQERERRTSKGIEVDEVGMDTETKEERVQHMERKEGSPAEAEVVPINLQPVFALETGPIDVDAADINTSY